MVPKTIGRYRIKAELGRGGMSTVYLAHDPHFERDVAVKLLPVELAHHPTFRRRFEREAKVVAALADPAIVPVYDFGEEKGQPYLVMRYMTGGSLANRLCQGPLSLEEAANILGRLAPALDEVHSHNVIHRDLKPSNILFDQHNKPYISDFGTVKMSEATTQLTDTGGAVGTPAYMSPEQIQGEGELDGRSDIYTLGIILYEMLSGKHPYQSNTPIAVAVKHMFEPAPRILDSRPDLPPEVQGILNKAMAKLPDDRFPTAVTLAKTVRTLVAPDIDEPETAVMVTAEDAPAGRRLALIISNDEYTDPTLAHLIKPTANVHRLVDVLRDPGIGGFDQVTTVVNEPADTIRRTIAHFFADRNRRDLLLLYFMGHAAIGTEEKLYLAAPDTEHNLLRATAVPASFIADVMDESQSWQQVLVLDCTFSNASHKKGGELVERVVNTEEGFNRNGHERIILAAADRTQYQWDNDAVTGMAQPSLFTHFFIEGLKTGAADSDQDGAVTIEELFTYVSEQLRRKTAASRSPKPRKWVSYAYQDKSRIVVAQYNRTAVPMKSHPVSPATPSTASTRVKHRKAMITAVIVLAFIILGGGWVWRNQPPPPAANAAALPTATATATPSATATRPPTQTPPPPATATVVITRTPVPSPSNTPINTPPAAQPITGTLAIAHLSSSIFDFPDASGHELSYIGIGDRVTVLGRSESGEWFFVETKEGLQGFIFAPRLKWDGDFAALPVVEPDITASTPPAAANNCQGSACPALTFDLYPVQAARCENGLHYRTIYMRGHGGNGRYTYYWKGQKVAGPLLNEGFGFEVSSADGAPVIGTGKVASGDGQTVEKELFVSDFDCP